jgi:hypothetical protein
MRRILAAAVMLAASPLQAQAPAELVGIYDGGQTEMAAGLQLAADGRFRYMLSYGAADEEAAGVWTVDADAVYLETQPAVVPPRFVVEHDDPAPAGQLFVTLAKTRYAWPTPLEILVQVAGTDQPYMTTTADEAGRVTLDPAWQVTGITPAVPVSQEVPVMHAIAPGSGHRLQFRFEPNDLGRVDFRRTALKRDGKTLVLERWGRTIRFAPMEEAPGADDIEQAVDEMSGR